MRDYASHLSHLSYLELGENSSYLTVTVSNIVLTYWRVLPSAKKSNGQQDKSVQRAKVSVAAFLMDHASPYPMNWSPTYTLFYTSFMKHFIHIKKTACYESYKI